jgi:cytidylate kinase
MPIIVAIDGPAGVGKSTTSRRVARALGIPHIDTGAMYRAIALKAIRNQVDLSDAERLEQLAADSRIEFRRADDQIRVELDGHDVTEEIRSPEISMVASSVSAVPGVRRILVRMQQEMGRKSGGVLEGRDIGTKVFPETPYKFFLTARPEVRARRRLLDLQAQGTDQPEEAVLAEVLQRDHQDSTRADSPLGYDQSYTVLDTSELSIDEVVDRIVATVRARSARAS